MKVLITGFGPFLKFPINSSQKVVETLSKSYLEVRCKIFDVNRFSIEEPYKLLLKEYQPDFILNIGMNASSGALNLETFAINSLKDEEQAFSDIESQIGYRTKLNTEQLAIELCDKGIPAIRSNHAGSFYCNFIYYHSLDWCNKNGGNALFLHIPLTTKIGAEYCKTKKIDYPTLAEEKIIEAIEHIIKRQALLT